MRIMIVGLDGYLGWPLAMHLTQRGHNVFGIDHFGRRRWVAECGSASGTDILSMEDRLATFTRKTGKTIGFREMDVGDYEGLRELLASFKPDSIVHLGEMPAAPFSMIDFEHAKLTHDNNVTGSLALLWAMRHECPDAHLLKLGTMGEYGTPGIEIAEGRFEVTYKGRTATVNFPRSPGSFYHATKVHDTTNLDFACRIWGLKATDIMQGVVYGTRTDEIMLDEGLRTRFDFDGVFGTAINRFCAQAVLGLPLTPYGKGLQKRGFLPLRDSIQCMTLLLEEPPKAGEYRVVNQLEDVYDVTTLAETVARVGREVLGREVVIENIPNPRIEAEVHEYDVATDNLRALGYEPTHDMAGELVGVLTDLATVEDRLRSHAEAVMPKVNWRR